MNWFCYLVRFLRARFRYIRQLQYEVTHIIIPRSLLTSVLMRDLGICVIASTLARSCKIPSVVKIYPQYFSFWCLKINFSFFCLKFLFLHLSSNTFRFLLWSAKASLWVSPTPVTNRSSAIAVTPSTPSIISCRCLWNSSGALQMPMASWATFIYQKRCEKYS